MYIYRVSDNTLINSLSISNCALINCATTYIKSQDKLFIAGG